MKYVISLIVVATLLIAASIMMETPKQAAMVQDSPSGAAAITYEPVAVRRDLQSKERDFNRFFRDDCVKTITIKITDEAWKGITTDMQAYSRIDDRMRTGSYRKADLVYEDRDGTVTIKDVGIRTKGNTTRVIPQDARGNYHRAHFKIKFDETFNLAPGTDAYIDREGRDFMGLNAIILKANMSNDPSYVHEKFAYDMMAKAGVMVPDISLVRLQFDIGGKLVDYGVYTMVEPVDTEFLKKRFGKGESDGNLYKCLWQNFGPAALGPVTDERAVGVKDWRTNYRPAYDLKTNKDTRDYSDLTEFISQLNALGGADLKAYLDKNFNVDGFLRFLACNMLLGMPDDYWAMGNNYYLYFNKDGKIEFIPYDYDQCLAAGWDGTDFGGYAGIADADIYKWKNIAQSLSGQRVDHPLAEKILAIDVYKAKYSEYLREFSDPDGRIFSSAVFMGLYDYMNALYGPHMKNNTAESSVMTLTNEKWYFEEKFKSVTEQLGGKQGQ